MDCGSKPNTSIHYSWLLIVATPWSLASCFCYPSLPTLMDCVLKCKPKPALSSLDGFCHGILSQQQDKQLIQWVHSSRQLSLLGTCHSRLSVLLLATPPPSCSSSCSAGLSCSSSSQLLSIFQPRGWVTFPSPLTGSFCLLRFGERLLPLSWNLLLLLLPMLLFAFSARLQCLGLLLVFPV